MSSLNLYGSYAPYRTPSTASEDDGVLKNFISPEVRAKIMTGRLFTVVEEGENWPDFGFFYYASKWSEIYECLDDDDDGDAPDEFVGVGSVGCYEGQTEPGSLSWVEWEELLRGNLCGRSFCETDDLALSPANNEEGGCAWSTDDFSRGEKLGRGAFGIVYAVQERRTGIVVAIKAVDKRMVEQRKCTLQVRRKY
ncbi:serine/threonine-protein kinase 6 [Culex quinquefasciatus]|uniref:Serine/threonine-protein kinase 6 n=1 Tax=Culex quinquefasciatus TaxID=7176 RepID=B0WE17_CULQU|nr:serine/threonine-protein kinase 6 [Culex quinquefasciatus]|eukprot:XP_001846951.1 serine/threonine-protein kinase 6 [Culex quinquefasciatus]